MFGSGKTATHEITILKWMCKRKRGVVDLICLVENEPWQIVNTATVFKFNKVAGNILSSTELWKGGFPAYVDGSSPEICCCGDPLFGPIVSENKMKCMKCARKETQLDKLIVDNKHIDQVRSFGYLGAIVNGYKTVEEEIRERIGKGNKAFYAKCFLKVIWCPGNIN